MTSSPRDTSTIEIAVKRVGGNPVTSHIHALARAGDTLTIDGGHGDFTYVPATSRRTPRRRAHRWRHRDHAADEHAPRRDEGRSPEVTLVYSASTPTSSPSAATSTPSSPATPHQGPLHRHPLRRRLGRPPRAHRPGHAARSRPRPRQPLLPLRPRALHPGVDEAAAVLGAPPSQVRYELWS